jgi:hypothetical protein
MSRTLQDVISRVRVITGDKTSSQFTDTDIAQWASDGQLDIVNETEHPQVDLTLNTVAGTYSIPVAGGYLTMREVIYSGQSLLRVTREWLAKSNPYWRVSANQPQAPSQYYWLDENNVNLYPTPDVSGVPVVLHYTAYPPALVNGTDVLVIPDEQLSTLLQFCLQKAKEWEEDWMAATYFRKGYADRVAGDAHDQWVPGSDSYPMIRESPGEDW